MKILRIIVYGLLLGSLIAKYLTMANLKSLVQRYPKIIKEMLDKMQIKILMRPDPDNSITLVPS